MPIPDDPEFDVDVDPDDSSDPRSPAWDGHTADDLEAAAKVVVEYGEGPDDRPAEGD